MISLFYTVSGVFGYILLGYIIRKLNFFSNKIIKIFDFISFNILLPIALIVNFWTIKFPEILIYQILIAFFGSGIIIFIIGFYLSKKLYNYKTDDSALFALGACFGNSVALGIPLMYSILGPVDVMPYMILVLFHGIIHFSYTTLIIESYRNRKKSKINKIFKTIIGLFQNVVLFGMFIGFLLNYSEAPYPIILQNILNPISSIALPAVLISLGIALGGFKYIKNFNYIIVLTGLKNFIYPMLAFIIAKHLLILPNLLVFIVTIAAALPSGSQTYYFSYRYESLQNIISANVVVSTFISFFTLSGLLYFFNY